MKQIQGNIVKQRNDIRLSLSDIETKLKYNLNAFARLEIGREEFGEEYIQKKENEITTKIKNLEKEKREKEERLEHISSKSYFQECMDVALLEREEQKKKKDEMKKNTKSKIEENTVLKKEREALAKIAHEKRMKEKRERDKARNQKRRGGGRRN